MEIETLHEGGSEDFRCHCGEIAECRHFPVGWQHWRCGRCDNTHSVNWKTGGPQGVPASRSCRALRSHGHALVDCLGIKQAYALLPSGFHFASSGVTACIDAINVLREALPGEPDRQKQRQLLHLQDATESVAILQEALSGLDAGKGEVLLHGYSAAGKVLLLKALLCACTCSVNAQRAKDGCTALHLAKYRGHEEAAQVLLAHGADAFVHNKWGETAEEAAKAAHETQYGNTS